MPSLDSLEEDIVIKAAILCTAGHYSLKLSDFKWSTHEDAAFIQNIIWAIEALQKRYPRYLQYARWVAIKQGIDIIEGKRKGYIKNEDHDHTFISPGVAPPPDMGRLMQDRKSGTGISPDLTRRDEWHVQKISLLDSLGSSTKWLSQQIMIGTDLSLNPLRQSPWILMAMVPSLR
jgi:hypothetical protein